MFDDNDELLLEELLLVEKQLEMSCCGDAEIKSENKISNEIDEKTLPCWEGYIQV